MQVPPPGPGSPRKPERPEPKPTEERKVQGGNGQESGRSKAPPSALDVAAQFIVDERTGRVLVRIYDTRTGETIRTIPPNQVVEFLLGSGGFDVRV
ncbi:MAG: flagellar protein FlaG [Armatimonadota bacterium]|nr:flagellar protein FlaG [Armatimonadota bacterium]MDR7444105.1 flagellar protein FlaG [Armatimonadota bacterium]